MQRQATKAISGHVFKIERKRGPQWYAKYRLPDGRQVLSDTPFEHQHHVQRHSR